MKVKFLYIINKHNINLKKLFNNLPKECREIYTYNCECRKNYEENLLCIAIKYTINSFLLYLIILFDMGYEDLVLQKENIFNIAEDIIS